jgi:phage repressor protein C with HTH and peptisase S24 domain
MQRSDILRAFRRLAAETPLRMKITGTCMTPAIADGTMVSVARARVYLPGDVVAVLRDDGDAIAHRVLGYRLWEGRPALVTQADRGDRPDAPIPLDQVLGRVETFVSPLDRIGAVGRFARAAARLVARRWRPA